MEKLKNRRAGPEVMKLILWLLFCVCCDFPTSPPWISSLTVFKVLFFFTIWPCFLSSSILSFLSFSVIKSTTIRRGYGSDSPETNNFIMCRRNFLWVNSNTSCNKGIYQYNITGTPQALNNTITGTQSRMHVSLTILLDPWTCRWYLMVIFLYNWYLLWIHL